MDISDLEDTNAKGVIALIWATTSRAFYDFISKIQKALAKLAKIGVIYNAFTTL